MYQLHNKLKNKIVTKENVAKLGFLVCATFSIFAVIAIVLYILYASIPAFKEIGIFNFLFGTVWAPTKEFLPVSERYGILPMIVGSISVTIGALLIGGVTGIAMAIYLVFFCPKKLKPIFEQTINLLAGIPSIIYGFFGLVVLVPLLSKISNTGSGKGILASSLILGIMILPTIANLSKNALEAVPSNYYEGSLALGASKEETIFKVMLPAAKSGVFSSLILGIGRAIGETMAVLMIAGNSSIFPEGLFSSIRTLTTNIVLEMAYSTGLFRQSLIATGCVLLIFVLILNFSLGLFKKDKIKAKKIKLNSCITPNKNFIFVKKGEISKALKYLCIVLSLMVVAALIVLIMFILIKGIPNISFDLLFGDSKNGHMTLKPAFLTTGLLIIIALVIALPIGIGSAIYLVEYAKKGSKFVKVIRLFTDTLAGVPSIVFGLFGMIFFTEYLKFGYSILAGALTLVLIILPTIVRSTEESLLSVPDSMREGSLALGASKVRTIFKIVLPSAISGIATAIILSIGRIIGESAALIYTAGAVAYMPESLMDQGASFAVMLWKFAGEGLYLDSAYATGAILLVIVAILNLLVSVLQKKLRGKNE